MYAQGYIAPKRYKEMEIQVWCACPVCHLPATKWETIDEAEWTVVRECTDCGHEWEICHDDTDIEITL